MRAGNCMPDVVEHAPHVKVQGAVRHKPSHVLSTL